MGVLAFLILPIGWVQKARAVAASLLTFSAIQLVNFMVSAPYRLSFLKQLFGRIPNQYSPYDLMSLDPSITIDKAKGNAFTVYAPLYENRAHSHMQPPIRSKNSWSSPPTATSPG